MLARTVLATALVGLAAAQSASSLVDGLSATCQSAALSLLTNTDLASCSAIGSLSSIVLTSGSVIDPINSWLETLCGEDDCSDSTLQNATTTIENGCSTEITAGSELVTTVVSVLGNFNAVKEGLCLQYTSNSTFCVTELLESLQNATGTDLTVSTLTSFDVSSLASLDAASFCTDCAHGLVTQLDAALSNVTTSSSGESTLMSEIVTVCGDSFADGQIPSTLSESTGDNSTSSSNGVESSSLSGAPSISAAGGLWKAAGAAAFVAVAGIATLA